MTPPAPSPERARLASALRELRTRTGLSLASLAAKTTFSKSSWERYLNGKTLPPRVAVQELCRLAGEPDGRCVALWEIAESEWGGRAKEAAPPPPPTPPPAPSAPAPEEVTPVGHRGAAVVAVLASLCAVLVGAVTTTLFLLPERNGEPRPSMPPSAAGPHCRGTACEGKDPARMTCAAAPDTFASHRTATGAWMELRYSRACGTTWARMWGTRVGDRIEVTADGPRKGRTRGAEVKDHVDEDAYVHTLMTATRPGTVVRACFRPAAGGRRECFEGRVN
ncbi:DUF2690 domain-containing protein [Streptomyces sp. NPDC086549]|uniref:helix-turn-helix domain-containing protein n=1 Tax=Streptomyces sp. NPDC086549 TaxID=3365752 RepID=UPI00380EC126